MDLDTRDLRILLSVVDTGSFHGAAEATGLSQSSVSRAVAQIEHSTRITVFDRSHRTIRVTPAGVHVVEMARRLVASTDTSRRLLAGYTAGLRGDVVVAALPSLAVGLLPAAVRDLHAAAPHVTVTIRDVSADRVERLVRDGEADLGLSTQPSRTDELRSSPLLADRLGCCLPREHRLASRRTLNWADVAAEPLITFREGTSIANVVSSALITTGIHPPAFLTVDTVPTGAAFVESGLGLMILPRLASSLAPQRDLTWRPLRDPEISREVSLLLSSGGEPTPAARRLIEAIDADRPGIAPTH